MTTSIPHSYVTTAIPYVNSRPHLGFALELVQADVLARHRRQHDKGVRFVSGTDDHALKNVRAAADADSSVRAFVDANAEHFAALRPLLQLELDDFFRTSADPLHPPGVERLWRACAAQGDIYQKEYTGRYCVGCELFYEEAELVDGKCVEHGKEPELVSERNWFFRLSKYQDRLLQLIESGRLVIKPEERRNEVLSFIRSGLHDFSISRSAGRAKGWGIPVPDDPTQVVYVWWDALGYYVTSLGYGLGSPDFDTWWQQSDERVQVIGKGILRFHAVYWPAILLSADLNVPTHLFVHDYLTVEGVKISKSLGNAVDPLTVIDQFGVAPLRWWLLRDVPRLGDADYSADRLVQRWNEDIVGGIGNLVNRVVTLVHKFAEGVVAEIQDGSNCELVAQAASLDDLVARSLDDFDFRRALVEIQSLVALANRRIEQTQPWKLARHIEQSSDQLTLEQLFAELVFACRAIARSYGPFVPSVSAALLQQLSNDETGRLPVPQPLFERL